jgi:hypothetical protein
MIIMSMMTMTEKLKNAQSTDISKEEGKRCPCHH